ncbi:MAG: hypothetical protein KGL39_35240 [Patescibacteria group bacterium]|nr:hypothetical protein [Patescibacteria group bacterium]
MTDEERLWTTVCSRCWHVVYDHSRPKRGTTEMAACGLCDCDRYKGATKREEQIRLVTMMHEAEMRGSQYAHDHRPEEIKRLRAMGR